MDAESVMATLKKTRRLDQCVREFAELHMNMGHQVYYDSNYTRAFCLCRHMWALSDGESSIEEVPFG